MKSTRLANGAGILIIAGYVFAFTVDPLFGAILLLTAVIAGVVLLLKDQVLSGIGSIILSLVGMVVAFTLFFEPALLDSPSQPRAKQVHQVPPAYPEIVPSGLANSPPPARPVVDYSPRVRTTGDQVEISGRIVRQIPSGIVVYATPRYGSPPSAKGQSVIDHYLLLNAGTGTPGQVIRATGTKKGVSDLSPYDLPMAVVLDCASR